MSRSVVSIAYTPPGPVARSFMVDDSFFRGLMGPFGSGKSTACIIEVVRRASEQRKGPDGKRHSRWAIIRNTYPELKTTTIKSWHQWIPANLGRWIDQGPPSHHITEGDLDLEVIFLALDKPDDITKLLSMELTGAWLNEAREIPKAVVDGLTGRVGRFPSVLMGGCSWSGIIADTNPPDSDHWWYRLAEEDKPLGWRFFKQPGGLDPGAENVENLPTEYYKRQLAGKDPDWIKVYVGGEYGFVRDGKPIYPEFKDNLHVKPFDIVEKWPIWVGIDFGLTPAAVFGQKTPMGQWRWHSELVTEDMGAKRFAELMRSHMHSKYPGMTFAGITGDPAGMGRAQTDETTPFQILRAAGVMARPAPTNDYTMRRESVANCLSRLIDGSPGLLLHPDCTVLRKGMAGGYNYKRIQVSGDERYRDVPDKGKYSHVCEAGQYMLMGAGEARTLVKRDRGNAPREKFATTTFALT